MNKKIIQQICLSFLLVLTLVCIPVTGVQAQTQKVSIFLEDFYNSLCLRKFERKNKFEVTNWQPFHFLCFAVNRYQRHSS